MVGNSLVIPLGPGSDGEKGMFLFRSFSGGGGTTPYDFKSWGQGPEVGLGGGGVRGGEMTQVGNRVGVGHRNQKACAFAISIGDLEAKHTRLYTPPRDSVVRALPCYSVSPG